MYVDIIVCTIIYTVYIYIFIMCITLLECILVIYNFSQVCNVDSAMLERNLVTNPVINKILYSLYQQNRTSIFLSFPLLNVNYVMHVYNSYFLCWKMLDRFATKHQYSWVMDSFVLPGICGCWRGKTGIDIVNNNVLLCI